jgi:hypothetical protein
MGSLTALDIIVSPGWGGLVMGFIRGFAFEVLTLFAWGRSHLRIAAFSTRRDGKRFAARLGPGRRCSPSHCVRNRFIAGKLLARRIGRGGQALRDRSGSIVSSAAASARSKA